MLLPPAGLVPDRWPANGGGVDVGPNAPLPATSTTAPSTSHAAPRLSSLAPTPPPMPMVLVGTTNGFIERFIPTGVDKDSFDFVKSQSVSASTGLSGKGGRRQAEALWTQET